MKLNPVDKEKYPYCYSGYQYALDCISGEQIACKFVIGASYRFLKDFDNDLFWFSYDRAERYLKLTQKFLHVKGKSWKTKNITYEPWQNFAFMNIMGWVDKRTNDRRFRVAHVEVPRGQGKSAAASQMALYFLALDNPVGNEISCLASKVEQARIVLDSSRAMAKGCPDYLKATGVEVLAHKVVHAKSNSVLRALSSESKSLDGLADILAIIDELHAVDKELFEVIYSGLSKRNDSLLFCITTAGASTDSIGYSQSVYAKKVALGEVDDNQFFSLIYTIDEGDDIHDERTWRKANPGFGISVDPITFAAKIAKTKVTPADLPNVLTKHFNVWISEAKAYYDLAEWDKGYDPDFDISNFRGEKCYVGVDLGSKVDLTTLVYVFRKMKDGVAHYYVWDRSYLPEDSAKKASSTLYDDAIARDFLIATPGQAIHYPRIEEDFRKYAKDFKIEAAHFDPWSATQFAQNLLVDGFNMVEFRMNTANLSEPTKTLDALIREGRIHHNGSPLLRWCLGNVVAREDAAGNVFPKKSHEKLKIDLAIGLIIAMAGWVNASQEESVYSTRGILVL